VSCKKLAYREAKKGKTWTASGIKATAVEVSIGYKVSKTGHKKKIPTSPPSGGGKQLKIKEGTLNGPERKTTREGHTGGG